MQKQDGKRLFWVSLISLCLLIIGQAGLSGEIIPPDLKKGDTFLFYGDSITHHNHYVSYISLFYYTRYPQAQLRFYNAGVGGNRISTGLMRFRQDVTEQRPALMAVLFGMNDGRYKPFDEKTFAAYKKGMDTILARVQKETEAKTILLAPSFYDHQKRLSHLSPGGTSCAQYNQTLVRYGQYLQELGKERDLLVIDLNTPMRTVTETLRQTDPQATLSRDGVHPLPAGHFVMAHAILKGFGVAPVVSSIEINAIKATTKEEHCRVTELKATANEVAFTLLSKSLPYPVPEEVRGMLEFVPFTKDLNQELLQVTSLNAGSYILTIDDLKAGVFSDKQLAVGINLSANPDTPQYKQALTVLSLHKKLQVLVKKQRDFRWMEKVRGYKKPDGSYPGNRQGTVIINEKDEVVKVSKEEWQKHFDAMARSAPNVEEQITALEQKIYIASQPEKHRYQLKRAPRK